MNSPNLKTIIEHPDMCNVVIDAYQNVRIWDGIGSDDSWSNNALLVAIVTESKGYIECRTNNGSPLKEDDKSTNPYGNHWNALL